MFLVSWQPPAFDRMQAVIRAHPELKTEFIYALRSLTTELNRAADTWGESRSGMIASASSGFWKCWSGSTRTTPS